MKTLSELSALREQIKQWKLNGLTVAFVPTMGNLHQGHFSLIEKAKSVADKVVASIFVNPMQFGINEDLDNYPRTLEQDQQGLEALDTDLLFTPTPDIIYPKGLDVQTFVEVPGVSQGHCAESRPDHFRGVSTVVCKFFNLVQPDIACFGEKDFQQLQVIRTMVEDLSMPIKIIAVSTKREESGLAKSSRNGYLTPDQKDLAKVLYACLQETQKAITAGVQDYDKLMVSAKKSLSDAGLKPDYFNICDKSTLQLANPQCKSFVILAAAFLGSVRLIDNIQVDIQ
ncbi:pantoate--beta-alanine ligase [Pseudoalteromonas denitrificans]|uniref:Pantothenate synthetase n=1 Tax=Pseudoalteromonas denitrificans DSM 6059 TaxID=1123010 RepID=A0A1I1E2U5_9GAMM|nr:pantoate--beta-alanine ligase [Pseudoalteromonas denitrificans]SFB81599.1 pantothenate synthetase [Pseudoalteromonas denitrificans DSM 6059]